MALQSINYQPDLMAGAATSITTAQTLTAASTGAFAVGANGATNPVLNINTNTASVATGITIIGAAEGAGTAITGLSSGANEALTISSKGTGVLTLTGTGASTITLAKAVTCSSTLTSTGLLTATAGVTTPALAVVLSGTSVPASAGAVAAGAPITMFSSGPSIYVTSDVPSFSAIKGSLCLNTGGSSNSTRLYINNGTTNWVAITTAS